MPSQLAVILVLMATLMICSQAYQQIFFINAFYVKNSFYCLQTILVGKLYNITCAPGSFDSATLSSDKGSIIVISDLSPNGSFVVTQLSLLDGSIISNQSLLNQTVLITDLVPDKSGSFLYGMASAFSYNSNYKSFVVLQPKTGKQTSLTSWSWRDFPICFGESCIRQAVMLTSLGLYCYPVEGSDIIFLFSIDGSPMQRFHLPGMTNTLLLTPYNNPSEMLGVVHQFNDSSFEYSIALIDVKANTVILHPVNFTGEMNPCPHGIEPVSSAVDLEHQFLFVVLGCPTSIVNYSEQKLIVLDVSTVGNFSIVQNFPLQNINNTESMVFVTS